MKQLSITEIEKPSVNIGGCGNCKCRKCFHYYRGTCPTGCNAECRGGITKEKGFCFEYKPYKGVKISECLETVIITYQDGYIHCPLIDIQGCEECYKRFEREE